MAAAEKNGKIKDDRVIEAREQSLNHEASMIRPRCEGRAAEVGSVSVECHSGCAMDSVRVSRCSVPRSGLGAVVVVPAPGPCHPCPTAKRRPACLADAGAGGAHRMGGSRHPANRCTDIKTSRLPTHQAKKHAASPCTLVLINAPGTHQAASIHQHHPHTHPPHPHPLDT